MLYKTLIMLIFFVAIVTWSGVWAMAAHAQYLSVPIAFLIAAAPAVPMSVVAVNYLAGD